MSTDFQSARVALGARLRELRTEAGLDGKGLATQLGWQRSKVSRLETGKQTATRADLEAWAEAVGRPDVTAELAGRLAGMTAHVRSWGRQLFSGHRARQEVGAVETEQTRRLRALEMVRIPGLLQTADYARTLFSASAEFRQTPRDMDEAVRVRMRRQQALYEPGKRHEFLIWEAALHALPCPPEVMAAQLDRLVSAIGLDTVQLGIVPFTARLRRTPSHGFWIYDQRLVIVETMGSELWLTDDASVALYEKAWEWTVEAAVTGAHAHRLVARARAALSLV
ncbi:helix-turn-helix transcriptional regulator [Streptomyces sp. SCA2-2]|uniref:helix-turn-helix domain-containing protein n=1 Tax=Streptomyces sp. SCA2-2 TaxID=1563677 RepID=UPI00101EE83F|nr:helix-turn-helix transcriptional regulator [Streptomyces sp. SCA2-2]RZE89204.1 transcriptional regulator [Streptomyces sp. SCA2-2]